MIPYLVALAAICFALSGIFFDIKHNMTGVAFLVIALIMIACSMVSYLTPPKDEAG